MNKNKRKITAKTVAAGKQRQTAATPNKAVAGQERPAAKKHWLTQPRMAFIGTAVAMLVAVIILTVCEKHLLWKVQELNLFLDTTLFFRDQMVVSGGMLTYLGTFFTQFFYYPWMGVLMLAAWWVLLMWLTKRAFRISDRWMLLLLVPVALLLLTIVDLGYWIYLLKLRGHVFVATMGASAAVALLWGYRCIPVKYGLRTVYIVFSCAVGYPLFGIYGLAATLLMGIWSWTLPGNRTFAIADSVVAVLCVIAVPLLCYHYVYYQTNIANIYWTALPLFFITEQYHLYYIPYYLLVLFFLVLVITYKYRVTLAKGEMKCARWIVTQLVLIAVVVAGVAVFWFKDENYHRELAMQHCIEQTDWDGVLKEASAQRDEPTRAIVMMQNLALARLGRQGNEMYSYKNGSKKSNAPFPMRMMMVVGDLIYYQYGLLNYCNRLCMELGVEFDFRAENYKYMIRCAVLNNANDRGHEKQQARKYIGILKHTLFHAQWAEHAEQLLLHPELIAKDAEMEPVTHMMHYGNQLTTDQGNVESFLMNTLSQSSYTGDPIFQEQALLASLYTRNHQLFWYHFENYVNLHPHEQLPLHVQEAALLYATIENRPGIDKWPFDKSVRDNYDRFCSITPRYDGMDVEDAREPLYPLFGSTFYYQYYLMANLPEY